MTTNQTHPFVDPSHVADMLDTLRKLLSGELRLGPVGTVRKAEPDRAHVMPPDEQARQRLVEHVTAHPGVTCAEAAKALGLTKSAVHHHANVLEAPPKGQPKRLTTTYETIDGRRQRVLFTVEQAAFERRAPR